MDLDRNNHNEAHPVANHKDAHKTLIIASITIGLIIIMFILLFSSGNFAGKATGANNDCGTNFTCFMDAAKDCIPVKFTNNFSIDILGVNVTSSVDLEIYEMIIAEKCIIKQTITNMSLEYTEKAIQTLLENGATQESIDAKEYINQNYAKEQIGTEINCQYPLSVFNQILLIWNELNASFLEPSEEYCSGDLISGSEGLNLTYSLGTENTNLSCQDSDLDDITIKGTTSGLELDLSSAESKLTSREDSCFDSSKVIEYVCSEDNFVDWELKTCPEKTICLDGACVIAPPLLNAEDFSKTTTKLLAVEDVDKPFWVITTLLDEDGVIILFSKILYPSLEKDQPYDHIVSYPDLDLVKTKKLVIFDVNDPSLWTVYLNETFEVQYEGLS
jgi:hypothetical protein